MRTIRQRPTQAPSWIYLAVVTPFPRLFWRRWHEHVWLDFWDSFECFLDDLTGHKKNWLDCHLAGLARLHINRSLSSFWITCAQEYPVLCNKVVNVLLPFATTFSAVTVTKSKYRARLNVCLSTQSVRRAYHPVEHILQRHTGTAA